MRDMSLGHINTFTFCIKTPVCHGDWMETDYISMSPGHELVPVHGMRDMSLGHIDTFAFCINTSRMSWRLDDDWLYFHVPGTWISSCSWYAWYAPGTYRHIYILYQNPPISHGAWVETENSSMSPRNYQFLFMACVICPWDILTYLRSISKPPACYGAWMETEYISTSPGHELVLVHGIHGMSLGHIDTLTLWIKTPVYHVALMETDYISMYPEHELVPGLGMRDMSLGHIDTFAFCINTSRMSWRLDGDW